MSALHAYEIAESAAEVRERLILEHLPQVRLIARRIHDRLPDSVSLDDLISTGIVGLISAIDRYDPTLNVKLKTYAEYKIRGAILDSLRGLDWAPRQQRKRSKQIEAAIASAERKLKRAPSEEEIAAELRITIDEYYEWLIDVRAVNLGSFEYGNGDDAEFSSREPQLHRLELHVRRSIASTFGCDCERRFGRVHVRVDETVRRRNDRHQQQHFQ
jgi:RNA polymerase sigma factor for flagellar operon FliA